MKRIFFFFVCLCILQTANAQLVKTLYRTVSMDEIENVSIDLYGEYELEKWAGNTIMIETKIELYDASPSIFKHFLADGRYEIEATTEENSVQLDSKDKVRKPIRSKTGECYEIIKVKLRIPDDFEVVAQNKLARKLDLDKTTTTNIE